MSSKHSGAEAMHPAVVEGFISPGAWALVESQFSPFAKETLTKVVHFVVVSDVSSSDCHDVRRACDPILSFKSTSWPFARSSFANPT